MKIYTSYFYQIRNFPPTLIPLSTAKYDPKWYHEGKSQDHTFIDARGVVNGLRIHAFAPAASYGCEDGKSCKQTPGECTFIKAYQDQLKSIDFKILMKLLNAIGGEFSGYLNNQEISFAFIVHEAPDNPCSERGSIQDWFKSHGVTVEEWYK